MSKPPKIVLIDGHSLVYRAFFALPETMKTSAGQVTNAIYGFATMLLKVIEEAPDHVVVAFDLPKPTFRHGMYEDYKANRDVPPDTFQSQLPLVKNLIQAFGLPIVEVEGYEADDILATVAKQAEEAGMAVEIMTGDRDLFQVVSEQIAVLTFRRGMSDVVRYHPKDVEKRYGISPEQIVDLKALMGDASDNIPGVKGVGEKTATQLLGQFKNIEALYDRLDEVKSPAVRKKLAAGEKMARLSKQLATICLEAPVDCEVKKLKKLQVPWDQVLSAFQQFEFNSLFNKYAVQVGGDGKEGAPAVDLAKVDAGCRYEAVFDEKGFTKLIKQLRASSGFAFDTETTGNSPFASDLVGISVATKPQEAFYIPLRHKGLKSKLSLKKVQQQLGPVFADEKIPKFAHNAKFDVEVLAVAGLPVRGVSFDTMIAAFLFDPEGDMGLKKLGKTYVGREMVPISQLIGSGKNARTMADVSLEEALPYAARDADITLQLVDRFRPRLEKEGLVRLNDELEVPLIPVLARMEGYGVQVDLARLKTMSKEMAQELKRLEQAIYAACGQTFNINSTQQLSAILFEKLKLPSTKRTKAGYSTDASVLETLAPKYEVARLLLDFRTVTKLKSTYVDALPSLVNPKTGRIHTTYSQTIAATGRLSSNNPNLQNIPIRSELGRKIRSAFVPSRKGDLLLSADYSQIELRILAHLSKDERLIAAFQAEEDIHRATASLVFGVPLEQVTSQMRDQAKTVNFGVLYGMGDFALSRSLGISRQEAKSFIDAYFAKYHRVRGFLDGLVAAAREQGYVTTLFGRKRPLPLLQSQNRIQRNFAERIAINTPIQGSAADLIKMAMIQMQAALDKQYPDVRMILQVHDELVFEVPKRQLEDVTGLVRQIMEGVIPMAVPLKVHTGVGPSWDLAK